jgi:hypothetical protein
MFVHQMKEKAIVFQGKKGCEMMNQSLTGEPIDNQSFVEGANVYDVASEKVGTVSGQDSQAGWLSIQQGWLFTHEVYVPLSLVVSQDDKGVFLNVSKDELKEERWKVPPTAAALATTTPSVGAAPQMGDLSDDAVSEVEVVEVVETTPPDNYVTQGTDVIETTPHTFTEGEAVIEQAPRTVSHGAASIDLGPDTVTRGTDTIEPEVQED